MGLGLYLCLDLARLTIRSLCHRRLCATHRGLARQPFPADGLLVLDALEQALHARQPSPAEALIHHSDRGSRYVSIRYSERLAEAGIEPSVGSKGDSYDNALAEMINALYKAEMIHRRAPWKCLNSIRSKAP